MLVICRSKLYAEMFQAVYTRDFLHFEAHFCHVFVINKMQNIWEICLLFIHFCSGFDHSPEFHHIHSAPVKM